MLKIIEMEVTASKISYSEEEVNISLSKLTKLQNLEEFFFDSFKVKTFTAQKYFHNKTAEYNEPGVKDLL